jgi:hypothetical protein
MGVFFDLASRNGKPNLVVALLQPKPDVLRQRFM